MPTKKTIIVINFIISFIYSYDLNNLLKEAYNNNYKIKSFEYQNLAKDYEIKKAKSKYYPSINLYSSFNYEQYTESYSNEYNKKIKDRSSTYGISIKQVLFDKTIYPTIKDSKLRKKIISIEKEKFLLDLYQKILLTYFQILINKENLIYKKLKKENFLNILKETETKYKYHYATKTELAQAKSNYISAINEYIKTKINYQNYLNKLKLLLLTNKNIQINGKVKDNIENILIVLPEDEKKIINNPIIKEDILYLKIAKNNITSNKALFYPNVYFQSNFYQTNHKETISEKKHLTLSININWNIYEGGAKNYSLQQTKKLYLATQNDLNYDKTLLKLDYNENLTNFQNTLKILKSDKEKINEAKEYLIKAEESLKYKTISLTDYYNAQNDYYQSLINFNNDKLNAIQYYLNLLKDTNQIKEKIKVLNNLIN